MLSKQGYPVTLLTVDVGTEQSFLTKKLPMVSKSFQESSKKIVAV